MDFEKELQSDADFHFDFDLDVKRRIKDKIKLLRVEYNYETYPPQVYVCGIPQNNVFEVWRKFYP